MTWYNGERSHLLGGQDSTRKEPKSDGSHSHGWRRCADMAIGFAFCLVLAIFIGSHTEHRNEQYKAPPLQPHQHVERQDSRPIEDEPHSNLRTSTSDSDKKEEKGNRHESPSKYTQFQAMGFQIYTGGAPALLVHESTTVAGDDVNAQTPTMVKNPECNGLNSYGHFDDYDITNNTLPSSLWQCYLGYADPMEDIRHRMDIMTAAVERAHQEASHDPSVLKIFIAPEFFWRGREGAYVFDAINATRKGSKMIEEDECTEVCQIMLGLEQLVSKKKYKDWLFLFGTVVVSEALPKEDAYDYLFYNFAPVYKGYDPETEDHHGKRFLVPKRYVSNVDFLTPVRQYSGDITKELVDVTQEQLALARERGDDVVVTPTKDNEPIVVQNPFELKRDFYDREMWKAYKDELLDLGYVMIEYDWLVLDNITMTIEVCLDHDAGTAINTFLADNVLGSPTRIPKSVTTWDPVAHKYVGSVEKVRIPRHQAQISLVSSMGMTANPQSLALTTNGTLILQDGQSSENGTMAYVMDCDTKSWHFEGGSEYISRTASITSTRIGFQYQIHAPKTQFGVFDDLYDNDDNRWKEAIKGVFTTTKYEPKITLYPVRDIATV